MSNTITPQSTSTTELPSDGSVENKQEIPIAVPVMGGAFGTIFVGNESNPDTYCSLTHWQQGCRTKRPRVGTYCSCPPSEAEFRDLMNSILKKGAWEEKSSDDAVAVQGK